MKIEASKIKSWVERVERLLEERAETNGAIRDIYAEVKSNEHDAKAIRKLIQRRAMDPADLALQDDLLNAYTDAIAGKIRALDAISKDASTKEAAKTGGISTGSVSGLRRVQKSRIVNGETCGGEPSNLTSETLEATVSEGPEHKHATGDAGTAGSASLGPSLTDVASRCEPGPQDTITKSRSSAHRTSDCTQPVEPTGNEGRAGERGTSSEQEALAAGEGEELRAGLDTGSDTTADNSSAVNLAGPLGCGSNDREPACPSTPPQRDGCSTDVVSMQHEIGAVAEPSSAQRVATDEIDLTPPSRLLAKRREIEERRSASQ